MNSAGNNTIYGTIVEAEPDEGEHSIEPTSSLRFTEKIGFAFGHVFNDLCAGFWYSYTLLFMRDVEQLPATSAGGLMLLGQVGSAIATPVIGALTDKFGNKQKWHGFGTFLVLLTFPLLFSVCLFCDKFPPIWKLGYFGVVILVFQCAWPIVQITHLAMIPELSSKPHDRSDLTAMRYSALITSVLIVYGVTWWILHMETSDKTEIMPSDSKKFRDISLILTLIGMVTTVIFHFSLPPTNRSCYVELQNESQPRKNFFVTLIFYQNASLYVFARLFMSTALVYVPLWLDQRPKDVAGNQIEIVATVPLASFLASFVASVIFKQTSRYTGLHIGYFIGCVIGMTACVCISLTPSPTVFQLYLIGIFYGAGHSLLIIASLSITANMIGSQTGQSGSVYSAVTFFDKLLTGISIFVIEAFNEGDPYVYYRRVLAIACGVPVILGALTLLTVKCRNYITLRLHLF